MNEDILILLMQSLQYGEHIRIDVDQFGCINITFHKTVNGKTSEYDLHFLKGEMCERHNSYWFIRSHIEDALDKIRNAAN